MDLTFLGTSSAQPSTTRNHTSMALRFSKSGDIWLFDAGEATQHQLLRSPLRSSKVTCLFITHLHGDHCFGLPGLLCTLSGNSSGKAEPFLIIGPPGLRAYLRATLSLTYSRLERGFIVHELHPLPTTGRAACFPPCQMEPHPDEVGGEDLPVIDDPSPHWEIPLGSLGNRCRVQAASIVHSTPCLGYTITEAPVPGGVRVDLALPLLEANATALAEQGIKQPRSLLSRVKEGKRIVLPDGGVLDPFLLLGPETPGRKVTILGDTSDPRGMDHIAQGSTVIIHEATNACTSEDKISPEDLETQTISHGHSTPQMAGVWAGEMGARELWLTHFSSRYKGDGAEESVAVMEEIRALAASTFPNPIRLAVDLLTLPIPRP